MNREEIRSMIRSEIAEALRKVAFEVKHIDTFETGKHLTEYQVAKAIEEASRQIAPDRGR